MARDADIEHVAIDAESLATRVAEGRFYVACVGQFKRGKSTLLNALVGEPVLPTGVVPVTSVVTVLRYGTARARVRLADGSWRAISRDEIAEYVTEDRNPENRKGVTGVEAFVSSPMLAAGMCLVDTPGIGSTILGNTAATESFVPHVDAALVVLGADPPISADELALIGRLVEQGVRHLIFVLNKADRLPDNERRQARTFIQRVISERFGELGAMLFEVAAVAGDREREYDWRRFCSTLERLARDAGSDLLRAAEARGVAVFAGRLLHGLSENRAALVRPLADSERRIAELRSCVAAAELSLRDLGYLLRAEQDRLDEALVARQKAFLATVLPAARAELQETIAVLPDARVPVLRDRAIGAAQDAFRRHLERWRVQEQPAAEKAFTSAMHRFVELADDFLARLTTTDDPALKALPERVAHEPGLRTPSHLYYTEMLTLTARSPFKRLLDLVRSRKRTRQAIQSEVGDYLERLVTTNAARLTNDLRDRVRESRSALEVELRGYLHDVYRSAERALDRARERRAAGEAAVRDEIERLDGLIADVTAIREQAKGAVDGRHRDDPRA